MKKIKNNIIAFPSDVNDEEREVEAILFAAEEPLELETIESRVTKRKNVLKILEKLKKNYANRGINLICISNKWSFRTSAKLSNLMSKQKFVGEYPINASRKMLFPYLSTASGLCEWFADDVNINNINKTLIFIVDGEERIARIDSVKKNRHVKFSFLEEIF